MGAWLMQVGPAEELVYTVQEGSGDTNSEQVSTGLGFGRGAVLVVSSTNKARLGDDSKIAPMPAARKPYLPGPSQPKRV
jgi:hypothetical protein